MSGPMSELYQHVILEHNRTPRNYRRIDDATGTAEEYNPVCGDRLSVFVKVKDGVLEDVGFQGSGCAISRASASLMTQAVKGRPVDEVRQLYHDFHELLTGADDSGAATAPDALGKLAVLGGVRAFPLRIRCAMLAWYALNAAVQQS